MSDLNNANLPTTASLRVDYADTMRANFNRAITLNPGSMTNLPVGALRVDSAGGTERVLQQWSGTAWGDFKLRSVGGFSTPIVDLLQTSAYIQASAATVVFSFDVGDYLLFTKASNIFEIISNSSAIARFYGGAGVAGTANTRAMAFDLYKSTPNDEFLEYSNFRRNAGTNWQTAGYRIQQKVDATYMAAIQFNGDNDGGIAFCTGQAITPGGVTSSLTINGVGRVLGRGIIDDGVTGLQVSSFSAVNQPRIRTLPSTNALTLIAGTSSFPFLFGNSVYAQRITEQVLTGPPRSRFTAVEPGFYRFEFGSICTNNTSGVSPEVQMSFTKNGVTAGQSVKVIGAPLQGLNFISTYELALAVNDYVEIYANVTATAGSITTFVNYYIQIQKTS